LCIGKRGKTYNIFKTTRLVSFGENIMTKLLNFKVPESTYNKVMKLKAEKSINISNLLRNALEDCLNKLEERIA